MKTIVILLSVLLIPFFGIGQSIEKFSIDSGGASASAGNIQILYTIGEVNVAERAAGNIQVSEGFINGVRLRINVDATVFLQGPIANPTIAGEMNDDLRVAAIIPNTSPYGDGLMVDNSTLAVTGSDAIVDWIWLELRDEDDRTIVVESRSALLQRDGNIVDVDGTSAVQFSALVGDYYLLVGHRNHLSILSAAPISTSPTTIVDLSSDPLAVFGGNNAVIDIGGGIFAMIAGDSNDNGQVQNSDAAAVILLLGTAGYDPADINMNGQIQNSDINNILIPNLGTGEQF